MPSSLIAINLETGRTQILEVETVDAESLIKLLGQVESAHPRDRVEELKSLGHEGSSSHLSSDAPPRRSLAGVWLVIPDHALGLPVLRALSLCACCRHYAGAAAGRSPRSSHPAVTAFPDNVVGSACTSSFSRIAQPKRWRGHAIAHRP